MSYKIYIGHSRDERLNYKQKLYKPLEFLLREHHVIILPHNIDEVTVNSKEIFPTCNLFIAEVSYPSTGLGMELAWAHSLHVPVLCIHKTDCKPSTSITNLFQHIIAYVDKNDMVSKISAWIKAHEKLLITIKC